MKMDTKKTFALVCGLAAAGLIAGMLSVPISRPANATPAFAGSAGKPCGFCHQSPAGGGALTPTGQKFKDNGNKL